MADYVLVVALFLLLLGSLLSPPLLHRDLLGVVGRVQACCSVGAKNSFVNGDLSILRI